MSQLSQDVINRIVQDATERIASSLREQLGQVPIRSEKGTTPIPLARAVQKIRSSRGQADTLRSLLAASSSLGARAALFVVRADHLECWQGVGFENEAAFADGLKGVRVDASEPSVSHAVGTRLAVAATTGSEHPVPDFGQAIRGEALLLPLIVNDAVAGLLYTDPQSSETPIDRAALETLVDVAGLVVEKIFLARASAAQPTVARPSTAARPTTPAAPAATSRGAAAETVPTPPSAPTPPEGDPEIDDARRFAKLLMEEICLYNGDKVELGRQSRDIASRLSDELQRARSMFEDRVPPGVRAKGNFFEEAIVRVLAVGDPEAVGAPSPATS